MLPRWVAAFLRCAQDKAAPLQGEGTIIGLPGARSDKKRNGEGVASAKTGCYAVRDAVLLA